MKTPRFTKIISITSGFLSLFTAIALSPNLVREAKADYKTNSKIDPDFSGEVQIPDNLTVKNTSSTKTSMGQSFSFEFSTGGQGFSDTTLTYLVAPDDENFESYFEDFSNLSIDERNAMTEAYNKGEYETVNYDGYIYSLTGSSMNKDIVIPRMLKRGVFFLFNIKSIGENACSNWTDIKSVTIPKEVEFISINSFSNVPSDLEFKVEYKEDEVPSTWDTGWAHGAKVSYNQTVPSNKEAPLCNATADKYGDVNAVYILGWESIENGNYPLTVEYDVYKNNQFLEKRFFESPVKGQLKNIRLNAQADCVGKSISSYNSTLNVDILLNKDETIDDNSVKLHNVFKAISSTDLGVYPDTNQGYNCAPRKTYVDSLNLEEFLTYKFSKLSTFAGYTAIDLDMSITDLKFYKKLKENYYLAHEDKLKSGVEYIRYRLTSLSLCSFDITYRENGQDISKLVKIKTPIQQVVLSNNPSKIAFIIKNTDITNGQFNASDIKALSFKTLYVTIDLYGERGPVVKSNIVTRFGYAEIMPYVENPQVFNIDIFYILLTLIYLIVYGGISTVLFFYFKNKYKNDEFRRLKPKQFIKKAIIGLLGSYIIIFLITSIILRVTDFANAIVVYNPLDAFIIVTGVISLIAIGYFIFSLFKASKAAKERKKAIKLKLADDVLDDGTK